MSSPIPSFWVDRSDRERYRLSGPDRQSFLHNLCTNDIKTLKSGHGCEMFVTSPQGKTLGYLIALASDDYLDLRADPGSLDLVLPHFAKYSVFDDIELLNMREQTFEIHLWGMSGENWLRRTLGFAPESNQVVPALAHRVINRHGMPLLVVDESPFGSSGFTVIGPIQHKELLVESIIGEEAISSLSPEDAEGFRIEAGTPRFGIDITSENLPQEIGRDHQTISFVKGCYLGQETVARLDALGHVNKLLRGIRVESGAIPNPRTEVFKDGKPMGLVTSSGWSPRLGCGVAMGILKVKTATIGQFLTWDGGAGYVSDFPIS